MRFVLPVSVALASLYLSGCASIVNGTNQVLSLETKDKSGIVAGATCRLENPKGVFYVTSPGTVTVHRAYDDLKVKCEKDNLMPGLATVKSSTKGMAFGNILFGGPIGVAIDAGSGAAYDYPSLISITMGQDTTIQNPNPNDPAATTPKAEAAAPSTATVATSK